MPPKAKFTKAEIIEAALNIVRADGYEALTSRALGTYLGSSARPIFTVFKNMEEVQQEDLQEEDLDKTGCTNEREMIKCQILQKEPWHNH